MKYFVAALVAASFSFSAHALIDMKNANFSDNWVDLKVPGSGYDLRIQRTYNSRTLYNGLFGFGWCSDFESNIFVTAEGNVKLTECGGGLEIMYTPKDFKAKQTDQAIARLVKEVKKRNPSFTKKYLANLKKELKERQFFREELTRQLGIEGQVKNNKTYFAKGRKDERIVFKKGVYTRTLPDGTFQKYNKAGKLTALYDRNNNYLKLTYKGGLVVKVTDNNGRSLNFKYDPQTKKIRSVSGPGGLVAKYFYKGEDLIKVVNGWNQSFKYRYDNLHNIIRVDYPDKTFKALTYNKDRDWVTSFRDRRGCTESYKYDEDKKNPLNHYWSIVTKKCKGKVTNKSKYEFWHRISKKGSRYLHRAVSSVNRDVTDVVYHETFGKPISVIRNRIKVRYVYNKDGLVDKKVEPTRTTKFQYEKACGKVAKVSSKYYQLSQVKKKRKRKYLKTISTNFNYSKPKCNLLTARNSDGQTVALKYDKRGRIAKITDQSKKIVLIKYEERFGKPTIVTRPGLGTLKVTYKKDGSIKKVDSKQGPTVAAQVASVFNNLLEIISPATSELSI